MLTSSILALLLAVLPQDVGASLTALDPEQQRATRVDWLVSRVPQRARVGRSEHPGEVVMTNGLVRRVWRLAPNAACVAFDALTTNESLLRAVRPEARLTIDGRTWDVGGLTGQPDHAYLRREWLEAMHADPDALRFVGLETGTTVARFEWLRKRWSEERPWPPPGVSLRLDFAAAEGSALEGLGVSVHYEMYDSLPVMQKWITLENGTGRALKLERFESEILAVVETESVVEPAGRREPPGLFVISDYAFHGMDAASSNVTTSWLNDPEYTTQVNYRLESPVLCVSAPPVGPDLELAPGERFESFRTFELVFDSTERERRGLAVRRMFRALAPWATENPIMMHVRRADEAAVRLAVDQCAEVGFEMVILTFGSGFSIEDEAPQTIAKWKSLADYAHGKGIELGGYSLLSSRSIGPETDVIEEKSGKPGGAVFGNAPCLESAWGRDYFRKLHAFYEATGFDLLEHDGSYPGDFCASEVHPGHRGWSDSQWMQWQRITGFYRWCRARGIYLNVPDFYFLSGSNKTGMGYRETNWSLPRAQQIVHGRQNIYDGTWQKTPSMGWMFVPLTEYHGGGAAATLEPLAEHLADYEAHLANNFGLGVQACYRGPRLYDTDETRAVVRRWVEFYKRHRAILDSDVIHVRRADGRDFDCMLHVNPTLETKALAMVFNPLDRPVRRTLKLPLYYAGLTDTARVREREGPVREYELDRSFRIEVELELAARGRTWLTIE